MECAHAEDMNDYLAYAKNQLITAQQNIAKFNPNQIPDYNPNPKEKRYKHRSKNDLKKKAVKKILSDKQLIAIYDNAKEHVGDKVEKEDIETAKDQYNKSQNEKTKDIKCAKGGCVETNNETNDDFGDVVVKVGALNESAEDTKRNQVRPGVEGIFKGANGRCRDVGGWHRSNCCSGGNKVACNQGERDFVKANEQGLAIKVGRYCSDRAWWGTCIEHTQSWCVFKSKMAKIIQEQGRKQLRIGFGYAGGDTNAPNCRGLTPEEIKSIKYDTPEMKSALTSLQETYKSKYEEPSSDGVKRKTDERTREGNDESEIQS